MKQASFALTDLASRLFKSCAMAFGAAAFIAVPLQAQEMERFDPDEAYAEGSEVSDDGDAVASAEPRPSVPYAPQPVPADEPGPAEVETTYGDGYTPYDAAPSDQGAYTALPPEDLAAAADTTTYGKDDLIGEAESVFGKGAEGLAGLIEDLLRKQGEPNGYIVGREAGGAFIFGARYGSGTLYHKVEGERKVYWTGPSVGIDAGANAANTFVLVYNLFDTEELFERYPAGEGQAYLVGGLHASYMRKGDVVLIPIRMGAGVRLGVNAGYMKFSKKQRWLPF